MRRFIPLFLVLIVAGCSERVQPDTAAGQVATAKRQPAQAAGLTVEYDQEVTLPIDELYRVREADGAFSFVGVIQDSRCPTGTNCIWAGEAKVQIRTAEGVQELTVHGDGSAGRAMVMVPGGVAEILALTPYPEEGSSISPEQYRLKVRITRATRQ